MRRLMAAGSLGLLLVGCVSSGALKDQVARADAAQKQAEAAKTQLDQANASIEALQKDLAAARTELDQAKASEQSLKASLATSQDKIATLQKSNQDLQRTLEAKKGDLPKKLSELIKERDELQSKLNSLRQAQK